jgi:glycosyltransferase involved in cell wall biosynthesis
VNAPDVSVVISTFNRCASLACTLDSLLAQQVPASLDYEIIVVDNNSSDSTPAVVESYRRRDPTRVRYVFEPQQGVSYGRNAGIRASRAPIVAFTDDDNEVDPHWVATVKATLDDHPDTAAIGGRILPQWPRPVLPRWLDRRHWAPLAILDYGDRPFYTNSSNPRCLLTANLAVRRAVFDRIGHFSPDFPRCQDHELLIRLWRAGEHALYTPDLVVRTRIVGERLTKRYHREWHARHGFYAALMRLQEIIDVSGRLVAPPNAAIRLYGTPGFVYRELGREARYWFGALLRFDRARAEHHRHRVEYLTTYIRRMASGDRRSPLQWMIEPVAFARAHLRRRTRVGSMSASRLAVAAAVIAGTAAGSLYDIGTDQEHWPFSQYPMFSAVERDAILESPRVFGVTLGPDGTEIPLLDGNLIRPFDQCRLSTAFARTYNNPARRALVASMLRDALERYERLRAAGEHQGPPLAAVRLYAVTWTLDPRARNVTDPDQKRLLAEVRLAP